MVKPVHDKRAQHSINTPRSFIVEGIYMLYNIKPAEIW